MDQPVAKAKTNPVRLIILITVLLLVIGVTLLLVDVAPARREVWVQDELGRPVLGAIVQDMHPAFSQIESANVAVSDVNGTVQLQILSSVDYLVSKDGYEPTRFPGSALAVPDAAGLNYAVKNGHFTVTLREKSAEVQLLDAKKMWQEGVLNPVGNMSLAPAPAPAQALPSPQTLPSQPLPNQPLPSQPLPSQPLSNQSLPSQPLPNQPLPSQPLPDQPLPNPGTTNSPSANTNPAPPSSAP